MAHHYMGRTLRDIGTPPDPLDSCAYSILAALFSLAEPKLLAHWTRHFEQPLAKRITSKALGEWSAAANAVLEGMNSGAILNLFSALLGKKWKRTG